MASPRLLAVLSEIPTVHLQNDVIALVRQDTSWTTKKLLFPGVENRLFSKASRTTPGTTQIDKKIVGFLLEISKERASR
jgi:hypothetical protein